MRKKLKNTRDYSSLLNVIETLPPVFSCFEFRQAANIKSKWNGYCALMHMVDQGQLHRKQINERVTRFSLSPFPEEAPKKPLQRVFTAQEYGDYYNYNDGYKMLHRAFKNGSVYKVGRKHTIGNPVLWSFNAADANSEHALNKAIASDIIASAVSDPFANVFR